MFFMPVQSGLFFVGKAIIALTECLHSINLNYY